MAEKLLLRGAVAAVKRGFLGHRKDQEKDGAPVAQRKPGDLLARLAIGDICVLVAMRITLGRERSCTIAEISFKGGLRPKYQPPHLRMEPVGADYEIETARPGAVEFNLYAGCV